MLRTVLFLLAVALCASVAAPSFAGDGSWSWPVDGAHGDTAVEAEFDAPDDPYGAGHRGVDLPALVGAPIDAVAGGVVSFAGTVAGVRVVSIDHGTERSTYQPVSTELSIGDTVEAGEVIGHLVLGPFHCTSPCLHLGRIRQADNAYLDPFDRLAGHPDIRLVDPDGPPPVPPAALSRL